MDLLRCIEVLEEILETIKQQKAMGAPGIEDDEEALLYALAELRRCTSYT